MGLTLQSTVGAEYRALAGKMPARFLPHDIFLFHLLESL
jgi:hypothetical protein